jgi:hypothetical protein
MIWAMTGGPITPLSTPGLSTPAIQAALLKEIGKQLVGVVGGDPLAVGQVVNARIGVDADGKPTLLLGGVRVPAQLPGNVEIGQLLRMRVQESSPERVVLQIVKDAGGASAAVSVSAADAADGGPTALAAALGPGTAQQAGPTTSPFAVIPMPGGAQAQLWLDPDQGGSAEVSGPAAPRTRTMVVRYDSPLLGRTDVVLRLDPTQLDATVLARAGQPLDLIRTTVADLRLALAAAVDRPVALSTGGRAAEELDVRA